MSEVNASEDALRGWDPRRRAALESVWQEFSRVDAHDLSAELISERRREAAAADEPRS